jgi:serine/threonine protein kinase
MSNGQSIPDDAPLDDEIESEEVLRRLIEYDEALGAGLTDSLDDDETFQRLNPDARRQVGEIRAMLELLNSARNSPDARFVRAIGPAVESTDILTDEKSDFRRIGRFQIVRELGRGGYGIVFLAVDPQLGRKVAVKVPRPETLISKTAKHRFIAEGRVVASLQHPNIVQVHEAGEAGPACYIISEYCGGPTLQQWQIEHRSTLTPRLAAGIAADLADAVEHAHRRGIFHRDLKPANILLQPTAEHADCSDGTGAPAPIGTDAAAAAFPFTVKLSDFGIAKVFEETDDPAQTMTGTILGTAPYMSPEQACGKNSLLGPPSDVYGLGAILYELLSGRPPFEGEYRNAIIHRIIGEEPVRPRAFDREIPHDLEAICLKCLEKEPDQRYATAGELRDDLRRFLAGSPVFARPITAMRRLLRWSRRKPASAALVLLAALSFIGFAVGGWWHSLRLQREIEITERERQRADDRGREAERQRAAAEDGEKRLRRDVFCLDAHAAYRAVTGGRPDRALELLHPYEGDSSVRRPSRGGFCGGFAI